MSRRRRRRKARRSRNLLAGGGGRVQRGHPERGRLRVDGPQQHLHDGGRPKLVMNEVHHDGETAYVGAFVGYHHGVAPGGVVWRPQAELVEGVEAPVDDGVVQPPDVRPGFSPCPVVPRIQYGGVCGRCREKLLDGRLQAKVPGALLVLLECRQHHVRVHAVHEQRVQPEEAHAAQLARHGAEGAMAPHAESVLVLQEEPGGKAFAVCRCRGGQVAGIFASYVRVHAGRHGQDVGKHACLLSRGKKEDPGGLGSNHITKEEALVTG